MRRRRRCKSSQWCAADATRNTHPPPKHTAATHRAQATPVVIRLGVLTVSDRASAGVYEDLGGPEVLRAVEEFLASGAAGGVTLEVVRRATVPDESEAIQRLLLEWTERGAEPRCNLLLTTGGTGLAPRDVTPEATLAVVDRPVRACVRACVGREVT